MVCWRFSLPSCLENMNARRACPFLGRETHRLVTKDPSPSLCRPSGRTSPPRPLNWSPGASASPHKMGGKLLLHRRWSVLFIPRVILSAFSGFLYLCGVTEREASGQGRSLSMQPPAPCSSSITLSSVYLLIYDCHKNVNSM